MKRSITSLILAATAAALTFLQLSCQHDDVPAETGSLSIRFDNRVGEKDLLLDSGTYVNAAGEDFKVSKLNYFISNIKLTRTDGSSYIIPQDSSYFLIRETNTASQTITLRNIPTGTYSGIEYMIGVDSLRSVSDISKRKGILDKDTGPTNEEAMYWDWNPGYIFLQLEGISDAATSANGKYYYHIGGFGGLTARTLNNLKTVKLNFGTQAATVSASAQPQISIKADILKVFDGPTRLSIHENTSVMFMPFSANIAANYANMFSVVEVKSN